MTPSRQSQSPRRVLLSGMFDMRNFGDLLFPLVARQRLSGFEPGFEILPVSPTGTATGFMDALPSIPLTEMMTGESEAHAILVGGGYMIHGHKMHFLEEYAAEREYAGPGLWLGATLAAAVRDIPIAWNAPGVPHPFARSQRMLVDAALRATDYISLRDTGSLELLEPPSDIAVDVVPDPIASLARMWPKPTLAAPFKALLERKGARHDTRYLALHFRNRSLARFGIEAAADAVDAFAQAQSLTPILVAVGQTHDDDTLARDIAGRLHGTAYPARRSLDADRDRIRVRRERALYRRVAPRLYRSRCLWRARGAGRAAELSQVPGLPRPHRTRGRPGA